MSEQNIASDARVYTDIQGLNKLRYEKNSQQKNSEVAHQFQSIMMQMVMHSMREANKVFSSGMFESNAMDIYQDLLDKQLSLADGNAETGFTKMIEKNIEQLSHPQPPAPVTQANGQRIHEKSPIVPATTPTVTPAPTIVKITPTVALIAPTEDEVVSLPPPSVATAEDNKTFATPADFIKTLWPAARTAAHYIGASPEILLAQAALETNWGKSIISHVTGDSTHNLFNIKAGPSWGAKIASVDSLEQRNGLLVKEKSHFRSYSSFTDSFMDFIGLLKNNTRYGEALNKAADPAQFVHALQKAGYATDERYAHKIMQVFSSPTFRHLIDQAKKIP